ncbi:LAMI_0D07800g1_1 [Lachancea mirantina]|uniref:LAMI_0D07800g1_1 n=1 Tax=Lachancea mirantina TaxID=1230905 RepID=A0A1G4JCI7_9SACH|nr:LAMI_0D07800g1_1 [Lachancea mirantina]
MKGFQLLATSLLCGSVFVDAEEFLVRLKGPKTLAKIMESRLGNEHLRAFSNGKILQTFSFGKFEAFTMDIPAAYLDRIRGNPFVADIVPNVEFNVFDGPERSFRHKSSRRRPHSNRMGGDEIDWDDDDDPSEDDLVVQKDAPRHLARISRRAQLPYNSEPGWSESFNYYYDEEFDGSSVNVYIIDTGIFKEHKQFRGRAKFGADFVGEGPGDLNGHGTHVAGLVGSRTFGVAKNSKLFEVKALNSKGQGNLTSVISAIEFSVNHCRKSKHGCVANLSLGSFRNNVLNQAVEAALEAGLVIVVAAGNSNANACWSSPASSQAAITVGAFDDRTDTIARFSNWGNCVDIFAPGVKVVSLSNMPPFKPVAYSGTSMASPIICGVAALLLDSGIHPYSIKEELMSLATEPAFSKRTLLFKPGTPNRIVFTGVDKDDDFFEDGVYPVLDMDRLVHDLQSYNEDGHVSEDDVTVPLGEIKLKRRSYTTLAPR